jgi:hypothetical protein
VHSRAAIVVRYYSALSPDGRRIPLLCALAGCEGEIGQPKVPGRPESAALESTFA